LDISRTAIEHSKKRMSSVSSKAVWLVADVTTAELPAHGYDVWHDRAVFHFLTEPEQRIAYVGQVAKTVKHGGRVIIGTFGPGGPVKCSGLSTVRYDVNSLQAEFGSRFLLSESVTELHQTPFGTTQQFLYCCFMVE